MLLKEISSYEKNLMNWYRRNYAYSDTMIGEEKSIDYILRFWNQEKGLLYKLLGNKLMHSEQVIFSASKEELLEKMEDMIYRDTFVQKYKDIVYREGNEQSLDWEVRWGLSSLVNPDSLILNKYSGENIKHTFKSKTIAIQNGAKPMRLLAKIAAIYDLDDEFEEFRLKHSQVLNTKELRGELVLSIHPLDFMTMSDNDSGWSSCMSWQDDGCYRRGTVEMMNSDSVLVAYLKAEKDMNITRDYHWSNKKWRQLFIFTPDFMTGIKAYPYRSDELSSKVLDIMGRLAKENLNINFENDIINYCSDESFEYKGERYYFSYETSAMYNDFESGVSAHLKLASNLSGGTFYHTYSGESVCMHCGEIGDYYSGGGSEDAEGLLVCDGCAERYYCDKCGCRIVDGEEYWVDGERICYDCYEDSTVECVDDGKLHLDYNTSTVYVSPKYYINGSQDAHPRNWRAANFFNLGASVKERFFDSNPMYSYSEGWSLLKYYAIEDLTEEGLEAFGFYSQKDVIDFYLDASLTSDQHWERWKAKKYGYDWLVDKPDDWEEIIERAEDLAKKIFP